MCCSTSCKLGIQSLLYLVIVTTGLIASISSSLTLQRQWAGGCILYGNVSWVNVTFFDYVSGPVRGCQLVVICSVVTCTVLPLTASCYYAHAVFLARHRRLLERNEWLIALSSFILLLVSLAESVFITKGLAVFCASIMQATVTLHRCSDVQYLGNNNDTILISPRVADTFHTFVLMNIAQLASWCGFMVWFILLAVFGLSCFDRRPKDDTEPHSAAITIDVRRCPDELDPLLLQQQQQQQ